MAKESSMTAEESNMALTVTPAIEDTRPNIMTAMTDLSQNLVYSVLYDYCNALIAKNVNEKVVLDTAIEVTQLWLNDSVKMRKRPAPRATKPRQPKPETIDGRTASARLNKNLIDNATWVQHLQTDMLSYTKTFKLHTGFPVKNTENKIVGVITDTSLENLTPSDVRAAVSRGYNIDPQYLDKLRSEQ